MICLGAGWVWQVLDGPPFKTKRLQEGGSPVLMTSEDGGLLLLDFTSVTYTPVPK